MNINGFFHRVKDAFAFPLKNRSAYVLAFVIFLFASLCMVFWSYAYQLLSVIFFMICFLNIILIFADFVVAWFLFACVYYVFSVISSKVVKNEELPSLSGTVTLILNNLDKCFNIFLYGLLVGAANGFIVAIMVAILFVICMIFGLSFGVILLAIPVSSNPSALLRHLLLSSLAAAGIIVLIIGFFILIYIIFIFPFFFSLFNVGAEGITTQGWGIFESIERSWCALKRCWKSLYALTYLYLIFLVFMFILISLLSLAFTFFSKFLFGNLIIFYLFTVVISSLVSLGIKVIITTYILLAIYIYTYKFVLPLAKNK